MQLRDVDVVSRGDHDTGRTDVDDDPAPEAA